MKKCNQLFVYGTLRNGFENEYAQLLQKQAKVVGMGYFFGFLYDLGQYPGAVYDPAGTYRVFGDIILLQDEKILDILDAYEGVDAWAPPPHEYKREIVEVFKDDQILPCWTYLYNFPVQSLKKISSGDYLQYISK